MIFKGMEVDEELNPVLAEYLQHILNMERLASDLQDAAVPWLFFRWLRIYREWKQEYRLYKIARQRVKDGAL